MSYWGVCEHMVALFNIKRQFKIKRNTAYVCVTFLRCRDLFSRKQSPGLHLATDCRWQKNQGLNKTTPQTSLLRKIFYHFFSVHFGRKSPNALLDRQICWSHAKNKKPHVPYFLPPYFPSKQHFNSKKKNVFQILLKYKSQMDGYGFTAKCACITSTSRCPTDVSWLLLTGRYTDSSLIL